MIGEWLPNLRVVIQSSSAYSEFDAQRPPGAAFAAGTLARGAKANPAASRSARLDLVRDFLITWFHSRLTKDNE